MPLVRSQCARSQSVPPLVPHPVEVLPLLSSQAEIVYQQVWHVIVVVEQEMRPMSHQTSLENRKELCRAQSPQSSQMPAKDTSKLPQSQLPNQDTPTLPWSPKTKPPSKQVVHTAVKKYLNTTKSRSYQDFKAVQKVTGIARQWFPQLEDYKHCWPILNMIHLHLKYLSSRHWQKCVHCAILLWLPCDYRQFISVANFLMNTFSLFSPQLCHILCTIDDLKYNV
ncbi:hypothetical protein F5J12DRAFT_784490 [Pisolithus orientalis]|uniref:uncharacterized protein n=1 Tax=Pisolithus orientalis TaxID=936130 RepID=UPI002224DB2F|nr:uncharacterized protein F5J12DRAFT_784490 [Pisolithus orientalis]KAI6000181.1 hypothetical protein F5J12DRAFT_784490 [Pisolithus orientalis]